MTPGFLRQDFWMGVCVSLRKGCEDFNFGHSRFEVPIVHSRGDF